MQTMNLPELPAQPSSADECVKTYLGRLPTDDAPWPRASLLLTAYLVGQTMQSDEIALSRLIWCVSAVYRTRKPSMPLRTQMRLSQQAIQRREREGLRAYADWLRFNLAEVYLQIIMGNEKLPFISLVRNLPIILSVVLAGAWRIRTLTTHGLANPRYDPDGHFVGRALLTMGLLYKMKKKRSLAIEQLTRARRILSRLGQTPILARVDTALAELKTIAPR